jgi:hypothetical protein
VYPEVHFARVANKGLTGKRVTKSEEAALKIKELVRQEVNRSRMELEIRI